jgi:hypothetical protein
LTDKALTGRRFAAREVGDNGGMGFILWVIAVILAIAGIIALINGSIIAGIILLVVACAVGPGGWSIFGGRRGARV